MKPIRLHKKERREEELEAWGLPNRAGEVRRTFLQRPPVQAESAASVGPVGGQLPEGRIAKIMPVAKPPGKLKLGWHSHRSSTLKFRVTHHLETRVAIQ